MGTRRSSRTRRPALQGDRVCEGSCRCRQDPEAVFCPFPGKATSALGHTDLNTRSTQLPQLTVGRGPSLSGVAGERQAAEESSKTNSKQAPYQANPLEERKRSDRKVRKALLCGSGC